MGWLEAIVLGLVQGLTEFLPISSSAHLRIVGELLPSAEDPGATFTASGRGGIGTCRGAGAAGALNMALEGETDALHARLEGPRGPWIL